MASEYPVHLSQTRPPQLGFDYFIMLEEVVTRKGNIHADSFKDTDALTNCEWSLRVLPSAVQGWRDTGAARKAMHMVNRISLEHAAGSLEAYRNSVKHHVCDQGTDIYVARMCAHVAMPPSRVASR